MLVKIGLAVIIIAVIITGGIFFSGYIDESGAAKALQTKVDNDNKTASVIDNKNKSLEMELREINKRAAEIQESIEAASLEISAAVNPNMITEEVIYTGERNQVTVIPLNTRDWNNVKIEGHQYQVFKMEIEVNGEQAHVIEFLYALQSLKNQPLVIEKVSLKKEDPAALLLADLKTNPNAALASVETLIATNILTDSATLNGNLMSLGADNSSMAVSFDYGRDGHYISSTPEQIMLTPGFYSAVVSNLDPGANYYFRAKAEGKSTKYGDDIAFWTLLVPPVTSGSSDINVILSLAVYAK
ncbi:MAG: hypothetical protein PHU23_05295 [Dehalococcoidales bacterium]|nr:hypothetical protein [Dehalococcoidales bacterium]